VAAALKAADPHAPQAALFEDKGACRAAAERFSTWLDKNLAQEAAARRDVLRRACPRAMVAPCISTGCTPPSPPPPRLPVL
jgi:hypothetical protein